MSKLNPIICQKVQYTAPNPFLPKDLNTSPTSAPNQADDRRCSIHVK